MPVSPHLIPVEHNCWYTIIMGLIMTTIYCRGYRVSSSMSSLCESEISVKENVFIRIENGSSKGEYGNAVNMTHSM